MFPPCEATPADGGRDRTTARLRVIALLCLGAQEMLGCRALPAPAVCPPFFRTVVGVAAPPTPSPHTPSPPPNPPRPPPTWLSAARCPVLRREHALLGTPPRAHVTKSFVRLPHPSNSLQDFSRNDGAGVPSRDAGDCSPQFLSSRRRSPGDRRAPSDVQALPPPRDGAARRRSPERRRSHF